jgi:hypothetical protein
MVKRFLQDGLCSSCYSSWNIFSESQLLYVKNIFFSNKRLGISQTRNKTVGMLLFICLLTPALIKNAARYAPVAQLPNKQTSGSREIKEAITRDAMIAATGDYGGDWPDSLHFNPPLGYG